MNDLPFETSFRRWCEREQIEWTTFRYSRPLAGGSTQAHRFRPQRGARAGVMFVHGAGNDALFSFTGLFGHLLAKGYEIFTFDLDGHGRCNDTVLSQGAAASAIPAALDAWQQRDAPALINAVGVSLGGSLLLHALGAPESRIASAALISAPLRVELSWSSIRGEIGWPMLRTIWSGRSHFGLTGLIPSFGPFKRGVYPLRLAEEPGPGAFGYVSVINELLDSLRLQEAARSVRVPVLLVYGVRDRLVPVSQARALAALMPRSELLLLPRDTHLSAPLAPAATASLVSWLERHQPAASRSSA